METLANIAKGSMYWNSFCAICFRWWSFNKKFNLMTTVNDAGTFDKGYYTAYL